MAAQLSIQAPTLNRPLLSDAFVEPVDGNRRRASSRASQMWTAIIKATSTLPKKHLPDGKWIDLVDLFLPHGNDIYPDAWRNSLRQLRASEPLVVRPRPICCNEDSIDLRNLEASLDEGCSWGYYDQGFGCDEKQTKMDWTTRPRERRYQDLSGFQTVPVNWSVNTDYKRAFFQRLREVTCAT